MPDYVLGRLQQALNDRARAIKGAKVLVLGVAYKRDVGDTRESPAMHILKRLRELGAEVGYHDPHVAALPETRAWPGRPDMRSLALTPATVAAQDAVLLVTNHAGVDYEMVRAQAKLIVDSRGVYRGTHANVVKA
jgi:UDP-N-acetyl-D-glucosamine dehydrogenase